MKPLYDQRCSPFAFDTIFLVAKGLKPENLVSSVAKKDLLETGEVPLDLSAYDRYGNFSKAFEPYGRYDHVVGSNESIIKRRFIDKSIFEFKKRFLFFFFMIAILGSLPAYAAIVISGPSTVCPRNETLHNFTAANIVGGNEVSCGVYSWTVKKNGQIVEERFGKTFSYIFDDIGDYQLIVVVSACQNAAGGTTSKTVNSRVKMPNPIIGPTICNTGQAYSFSTSPPLPYTDNDCNYHYEYLWNAPSGWKINGGSNTLFAHASTVSLIAPAGTPPGNYTISVQSSIPNGGVGPIQSNSWFSTARTYSVRVGAFTSSQISVSGPVSVCGGNTYTYNANVPGGHKSGYTYNWTYPAGWVVQYTGSNTIQLYVPSTFSSYGTVRVSVNNGCGSPSPYTGVTVYPCNYMASGNFLIYPNPSEGELNVEYFDEKEDSSLEENNFTEAAFHIELYDKQENLVRTGESKSGKVNLETSNMQPGTYFLQIRIGTEVFREQVLIK